MFNDGRMKDIFCGNPTCPHCGSTYGIAEIHNCEPKQKYLLKRKEDAAESWRKAAEEFRTTLRDQFAMSAMNAIIAKAEFQSAPESYEIYNKTAIGAYDYADAMMKARSSN